VDQSSRYLSPAETARALGLTVRALRVYEREGLLKPHRASSGWRAYGPDQIARLHQILALKRLGLPLARIGELLRGGALDLEGLLSLQEQQLLAQQAQVDGALRLVRAARVRLTQGEALGTEHLIQLIKVTTMSEFQWTDAHEALAREHFTPEQMAELKARKFNATDQQQASAAWTALIAEAERLRATLPPSAPEAMDLARRWQAEVAKFTGGDKALEQASAGMYRTAFQDPDRAPAMPFSPEVWTYVSEAARHARDQAA
jgi:DNA-binding transcriptional MerR regulator